MAAQLSWHLPLVTRTLSTASTSEPALTPRALIISRNCLSTFLKVTWALTQVSLSGLSCSIVTLPGLPLLGHASTVRLLLLPSAQTLYYHYKVRKDCFTFTKTFPLDTVEASIS